jgi:RecA-family ATPase
LGDPGQGKSLISLDLAARVTSGRGFPDGAPGCSPQSVLAIGQEDGLANTVLPRFLAAGGDAQRVHLFPDEGPSFTLPGGEATIEAGLRHDPEIKLIVVDPIGSYLDGIDTHRDAPVRTALRPVLKLVQKHGVSLLLVGHLNKSGGGAALYRGMGSIAFVAVARIAMVVARDRRDPTQRFLIEAKNNLARQSRGLGYKILGARG